jgi:hypothetical protein
MLRRSGKGHEPAQEPKKRQQMRNAAPQEAPGRDISVVKQRSATTP